MAENVSKNMNEKILKLLLYLFAVYHVVLGLVGMFLTNFAFTKDIALNLFNFHLTIDNQTEWILKPLGAYMLVMGILAYIATLDLSKHKAIVYAAVGVIVLRILERLLFVWRGEEYIATNPTYSLVIVGFLAIYGTAIYYFAKKI